MSVESEFAGVKSILGVSPPSGLPIPPMPDPSILGITSPSAGSSMVSVAVIAGPLSRSVNSPGAAGVPSNHIVNAHTNPQILAAMTVITVKVSPDLLPKALWPPGPPRVPASPPPRPRWTSTSMIRKSERKPINQPRAAPENEPSTKTVMTRVQSGFCILRGV